MPIIITALMLSVALPITSHIIIHHQQQEALAIQEDSITPVTNADCGQLVKGFVELNLNLNCNEDGLIVGADGTTIRLNNHTITGPGPHSSKVGISVGSHDNVTIEGPGTIEHFQTGILASGAKRTLISKMIIRHDQIGVSSTGTKDLQVSQNMITDNEIGMASHSSNSLEVIKNRFTSNILTGISLVNTLDSNIYKNNLMHSQNGIFTDAQSSYNRIGSNEVHNNVIDLNNGNGLPINVNSNNYSNNKCETSNPDGLCTIAINTLQTQQ